MQPLSAPELLAVWEENWRQSSLRQGLALLAAAHPEESFETLAQMPMGRYNAALLTLHAWHFGPALTAVTDCPGCGELVEVTLDAPGLCAQAAELAPAWLEIAYAERALRFRLPSPADLAAAGEAATIEAARQILAQRCVEGAAPPAALLPEIAAAMERADPLAVELAAKALEMRLRDEAKKIRDKYVEPPHTTDFAILYLPTEGLYAEVLRRPGLADGLQRDFRISIAGPTTLAALLNSLQMGFRTLAIEQRSSEVWIVLGAIKSEFGKFGEALEATRKKLEQATRSIESAGVRTRQIERKLKGVEALPVIEAQALLGALEEIEAADEET